MPKISVIVPVYKVKEFLNRCIDSILAQTFADFELILVDDGSPDECGAICDEYAKKDSRIVVIHKKNGGLSDARNKGIDWAFAHSDSQWLTFIDSDDWIHPEYLERLHHAAVTSNVSVSICGYVSTEGWEPTISSDEMEPAVWQTESFYVAHNTNATVAWGKLYRKECFQTIRYPFGKLHEDEFITYRVLFEFLTVAVISAPLYFYYVNPNSIVQSGQSRFREDKYLAMEEQIQYFHTNHFNDACRSQARMYLSIVDDKIRKLSEEPENQAFLKIVKRRKRQTFFRFARFLDPKEDADAWTLTKVFPKSMKIYWNLCAIGRKLRIIK